MVEQIGSSVNREGNLPQAPNVITEVTIGNEFIDQYGHVNYKRFPDIFEKGQDDLNERAGINFDQIEAQYGLRSFVITMKPTYKGQVKIGDQIKLYTAIDRIGNTSITYGQRMENAGTEVADFQLVVVLVNSEDKPTRIPDDLKQRLKPFVDKKEDLLNQPIEALGLSNLVKNTLIGYLGFVPKERGGSPYGRIRDIDSASDEELLKVKRLGPKSLEEIRERIAAYKAENGL